MRRQNLICAALVAGLFGAICATGAAADVNATATASLCGVSPAVDSLLGCPQQQPARSTSSTESATTTDRTPAATTAPQLLPGTPVARPSTQPRYVPNVVVVRFRAGVPAAAQARLLRQIEAKTRERIPQLRVNVVSVASVQRAQAKLDASPLVLHATRDEILHVLGSVPNDTFFSYEWGFRQAGFGAIWRRPSAARPVIVAVIDTGVDATQPDLAGVVRPQIDLVDGGSTRETTTATEPPSPASSQRSRTTASAAQACAARARSSRSRRWGATATAISQPLPPASSRRPTCTHA